MVQNFISGVVSAVSSFGSTIANLWNSIKSAATNTWNNLCSSVTNIVSSLKNSAVQGFNNMLSGIRNTLTNLPSIIRNGFSGAISYITSLPRQALSWGRDLVNGIANGTEETITLEDAPPYEIGEADIVIGSGYTAMLERDRTIEAAADAIIQSLQSGEVSFGLNANLEADLIAGKITAAAALEANRRSALESEVDVSTIESAIAACVLRKLMESSISVETQIKASMILSLIRFAESTDNIVHVSAESDAVARVPKKLQGKTQYITAQTAAFLDASYMRGDGLLADARIRIETDVMPEAVNSGT